MTVYITFFTVAVSACKMVGIFPDPVFRMNGLVQWTCKTVACAVLISSRRRTEESPLNTVGLVTKIVISLWNLTGPRYLGNRTILTRNAQLSDWWIWRKKSVPSHNSNRLCYTLWDWRMPKIIIVIIKNWSGWSWCPFLWSATKCLQLFILNMNIKTMGGGGGGGDITDHLNEMLQMSVYLTCVWPFPSLRRSVVESPHFTYTLYIRCVAFAKVMFFAQSAIVIIHEAQLMYCTCGVFYLVHK